MTEQIDDVALHVDVPYVTVVFTPAATYEQHFDVVETESGSLA